MSNTLNTIHYAVEIDTGSSLDRASIGLYTGKFRYVTDDYNTSGATYEDTSAVTEVFNTDLLLKNGIKQSSQSIDLISGGDYSFLAGMSIDLVNTMNLHKIITSTAGLYLVGSTMTFYVIIDDVFYTKWTGVVSEYNFDDSKFTFIGADKNNSNNNTISNVSFGYNYSKLTPVVENEQAILESQFIKIVEPEPENTNRPVQWFDTVQGAVGKGEDDILKSFNGFGKGTEITTNPSKYRVYLNGNLSEVTDGMFARFDGDETLYPIDGVATGQFNADGGGSTAYTSFLLSRIPDGLTTYTQLYGEQPTEAPPILKTDTAIADTETTGVSIYQYGNSFLIPDGSEPALEDGRFVTIDGDGNTVRLNGKINSDGTITITDTNYYSFTPPASVMYFSDGLNGSLTAEIEAGTAKNIEQDATGITDSIPNDLNIDGDYWFTDPEKNHYFVVEFEGSIEGKLPAIILSSGIDSTENWALKDNQGLAFSSIWFEDTYTLLDNPTVYNGRSFLTASVFSNYPVFDFEVYNIVSDIERGEVPFLASEFSIINTRDAKDIRIDSNSIDPDYTTYSIDVVSVPTSTIDEDFFKTIGSIYPIVNTPKDNYLVWDYYEATPVSGSPQDYYYPLEPLAPALSSPSEIASTSKVMFRIQQNSTYDGNDNRTTIVKTIDTNGQTPDTATQISFAPNSGSFGVNTIGLYEVNVLTTSSDLSFTTVNETNGTYESIIQELSGSSSSLPNRDQWSVGGVIEGEVNTFSLVTTLCKQGYVAGYTNRLGEVVLNEFIENTQTPVVHDNNNTIDNSISKFKLSSISKCYNEFTVKYHYINGKNQKTLGVYNVEESAFPAIDDVDPVWVSAGSFSDTLEYDSLSAHIYTFKAEKSVQTGIIDADINNLFRATLTGFNGVVVFSNAQKFSEDATHSFYDVEIVSTSKPLTDFTTYNVDYWYYNTNDSFALWQSYVVGIASYPDAKEIWQQARNSYLLNSRIRKAPSERTDLKYAVDLNLYSTETSEDESEAYARSYFKQLISWTTRQKLQVSYKMPITDQTILYNITDRVSFSDPIITPDTFEYADGWITSLGVDPMNDVVNVTLTLDPDYLTPVKAFPECDFIIEDYANTDTITEAYTNIDTITEQYC